MGPFLLLYERKISLKWMSNSTKKIYINFIIHMMSKKTLVKFVSFFFASIDVCFFMSFVTKIYLSIAFIKEK